MQNQQHLPNFDQFHHVAVECPFMYLKMVVTFNVPQRYTDLQFLSLGTDGILVIAVDQCGLTNHRVVIKKLRKSLAHRPNVLHAYRELVFLKNIQHSKILRLRDAFMYNTAQIHETELYLVTEYAGMSLRILITPNDSGCRHMYAHREIAKTIYQILLGVKHLHDSGIIHRDLKPDNISMDEKGSVTILDFGLARQPSLFMTTNVTTRWYRAPEVALEMEYDGKLDVWSIGCIMAELVKGVVCFPSVENDGGNVWHDIVKVLGTPNERFIAKLPERAAEIVGNCPRYPVKSMEEIFGDEFFCPDIAEFPYFTANCARDLLGKMLKIDPEERISVNNALQHPYFTMFYNPTHLKAPVNNYIEDVNLLNVGMDQLFAEVQEFQTMNRM